MKKKLPPELKKISQCDKGLAFPYPQPWPQGLPAVAVNGLVLAGFQQEFVFDHQLDVEDSEEIAKLFRSLYFELSAVELSWIFKNSKKYSWLPVELIFSKFNVRLNEQIENLASAILLLPSEAQHYCALKKWNFSDFAPLAIATKSDLNLESFFKTLSQRNGSKSLSVQIFELYTDLRLMGQDEENLLLPSKEISVDHWLLALKHLRYPQAYSADQKASEKIHSLGNTHSSIAKWVRQGDKSGIEIRFFVSQPSDLKKYSNNLEQLQIDLEKNNPWKIH